MAHFKHKKGSADGAYSVESILERAAEGRKEASPPPPITNWDERRQHVHAPHALTPDELLGRRTGPAQGFAEPAAEPAAPVQPVQPARPVEDIPMESARPAAKSLYERMMQARNQENASQPAVFRASEKDVTAEEADIALKAFAAALSSPAAPAAEPPRADADADSLTARTRQFTQQAAEDARPARRVSALDTENVDDIIRRFEQKAQSRAIDLYGATAELPPLPDLTPAAPKAAPAASSLFDWEKDEKENKNLPRYGPDQDEQPMPARRNRPVLQTPVEPVPGRQADVQPVQAASPSAGGGQTDQPAPAAQPPRPIQPPAATGPAQEKAEEIPTRRVTPVRKARRFSTPTESGEAPVSRLDVRPLSVEVSPLGSGEEQPVMTTAKAAHPAPRSVVKAEPEAPAEPPLQAASQYSLADGGLSAANEVYKKSRQRPAVPEAADLSSFSDPAEKPADPLSAVRQEKDGQPSDAAAHAPEGADASTIQFSLPVDKAAAPAGKGRRKVVLFGDVEEENAPEEMPPELYGQEAEEIDDYETDADAASIRADLRARSRRLKARFLPTLLITAALFLLSSPLLDGFKAANLTVYLILNIVLVCLAALINLNIMKGLGSLFRLRPDMDTPAALALVGVLVHSVVMLATGNAAGTPQLGGLGAMALLFGGIGKMTLLSRIRKNFEVLAEEGDKQAVTLLDDPALTSALADGAVIGEALICARRKTRYPQNFLQHSYCPDPYERAVLKVSLAALALAVAGGIAAGFLSGLASGMNLAAALLCLACPPTTLLLSSLPMKSAAKRLAAEGAVLTGYEAAENLSYANAIAFSADELFPAGRVRLYRMHLLSANPVDEAILQAAALAREAHSPLYSVFRQMLDKDTGLPSVKNITFGEQKGLSGWCGKTRILLGTRELLQAHGIKTPAAQVDAKIRQKGGFPVYLAVGGQPSCLFVVGYAADENIAYELQRLSATGVTLLIHSTDPNLTAPMLCDAFGLYGDSLQLIAPEAAPLLEQATEPAEKADAPAFYRGSADGFAALLTAAIRLKGTVTAMTALHVTGMCLGGALAAYFILAGLPAFVSALPLAAYQLLCTLITCLVPLFRKS
ncbi:MAG TPA: hypothetical protein H9668_07725 [Firmicutes bacterium]|nr:hypothetical protein [Bacillota bacterium]